MDPKMPAAIDPVLTDLLAEAEADRLVIVAGAGLSMAPPSGVPSAGALAKAVRAKYQNNTGADLPPEVVDDIEKIACWFLGKAQLRPVFMRSLIDWGPFRRNPNSGHLAVADFLAAGIFEFAVTTNVDWLVEKAAELVGERDFEAAIDGKQAGIKHLHRTLLKLHGCIVVDRENTVWCRDQLKEPVLSQRVESAAKWLQVALQGKTIIVVGFWSDWDYLNSVLEQAVVTIEPQKVYLIDPAEQEFLKGKAPELWEWASGAKVKFEHVRASGAEFLNALRERYSRQFLARLLNDANGTYVAKFKKAAPGAPPTHALASADLYALRQDASGVTRSDAVRAKRPDAAMRLAGATHLWLAGKGAQLSGASYVLGKARIRVLQGAGQVLSEIKRAHEKDAGPVLDADLVVCAGADDDGGAPLDVVRGDRPGSLVRPAPAGEWVTLDGAIERLGE